MEERYFAIGDIHGCLDRFERLLDKIPFKGGSDRLVFIGDYIDRGPDSKGVIDRILQLRRDYPETICLKGNHESMLQKYLDGKDKAIYIVNGGDATLNRYGVYPGQDARKHIPRDHLDFYKNLPLYFETSDYIFVHAGLRPNVPLADQDPEDMLWIRKGFFKSDVTFGKTIIFGHTPFKKPLVMPDRIGIDTGAVYGNKLTCVELPALKFYQV